MTNRKMFDLINEYDSEMDILEAVICGAQCELSEGVDAPENSFLSNALSEQFIKVQKCYKALIEILNTIEEPKKD